MTIVGIIRHGVTDWNVLKRIQGQTNIPLNSDGRKQAEALARRLSNEKWDYAYSSDLLRASETAQIIISDSDINLQFDERLRERNFGQIEGTTEEERIAKWGPHWNKLDLGKEAEEAVQARAAAFMADIVTRHRGNRILIVSHGALIGQALQKLVPQAKIEAHLLNCGITMLRFADPHWECDLYNCIKHLEVK
jgi:probable phosphoglycerate mutase